MRKLVLPITLFVVICGVAAVLALSTIDPSAPTTSAPLSSAPIRANFAAAYAEINALQAQHPDGQDGREASIDNRMCRFNGVTGQLQNSLVTVGDTGTITGANGITSSTTAAGNPAFGALPSGTGVGLQIVTTASGDMITASNGSGGYYRLKSDATQTAVCSGSGSPHLWSLATCHASQNYIYAQDSTGTLRFLVGPEGATSITSNNAVNLVVKQEGTSDAFRMLDSGSTVRHLIRADGTVVIDSDSNTNAGLQVSGNGTAAILNATNDANEGLKVQGGLADASGTVDISVNSLTEPALTINQSGTAAPVFDFNGNTSDDELWMDNDGRTILKSSNTVGPGLEVIYTGASNYHAIMHDNALNPQNNGIYLGGVTNPETIMQNTEKGAKTTRSMAWQTISASGASVTATNLIPAGVFLIGITVHPDSVAGATNYDVGKSGELTIWGNNEAVGTDADIEDYSTGLLGFDDIYYPAAASVVITAQGGTFSGGTFTVTAHYIDLFAASAP